MKKIASPLIVLLAGFGLFFGCSENASADHDRSLVAAAKQFKSACKSLEIEVMRCRYIARPDVHLVNDYEARSIALHGAAHNTRDLDRLVRKWTEVTVLHSRVERTLFDPRVYPHNAKLSYCWDAVTRAYLVLAREIDFIVGGGGRYGVASAHELRPPIGASGRFAPTPFVPAPTVDLVPPPVLAPNSLRRPSLDCPSNRTPSSGYYSPYDTRTLPRPLATPFDDRGGYAPIPVPPVVVPPVSQPAPRVTPRIPFEVSVPRGYGPTLTTKRYFENRHGRMVGVGARLQR